LTTKEKTSLPRWLAAQGAAMDVCQLVEILAGIGTDIAAIVRRAPGTGEDGALATINVQGEEQKTLDVVTNNLMVARLSGCERVCAMVSEETSELIHNPSGADDADIVVCFDPLDGSSNIETNSAIGTIFSLLRAPASGQKLTEQDVLAASGNQIGAGYVLYGPATLLVVSVGVSVAVFALEPESEKFVLVRNDVSIAPTTSEFAVNSAYERFWEPELAGYVNDCVAGKNGPRGRDFNMRWTGSMVADIHRIMARGGIFIYPALDRPGAEQGKLRFLYEANPMAMLVENAGGKAMARTTSLRDFSPASLHARAPVVLGSSGEVELLAALYARSGG